MTLSARPEFRLPRAEGGEVHYVPSSGTPTVVIFTGNRCPYALAWHDRIQQLASDYQPRGVRVLQISSNDDTVVPPDAPAESAARVARGEFASPYLRDEDQSVARAWGATKTPHAFVIDGDGALVYEGAPDNDHDDPSRNAQHLRAALKAVLAGEPVAVAETEVVGCGIKWKGPAPV